MAQSTQFPPYQALSKQYLLSLQLAGYAHENFFLYRLLYQRDYSASSRYPISPGNYQPPPLHFLQLCQSAQSV